MDDIQFKAHISYAWYLHIMCCNASKQGNIPYTLQSSRLACIVASGASFRIHIDSVICSRITKRYRIQ